MKENRQKTHTKDFQGKEAQKTEKLKFMKRSQKRRELGIKEGSIISSVSIHDI